MADTNPSKTKTRRHKSLSDQEGAARPRPRSQARAVLERSLYEGAKKMTTRFYLCIPTVYIKPAEMYIHTRVDSYSVQWGWEFIGLPCPLF